MELFESLIALWKAGTMAGAATKLRVTASAISKRIALLEQQVGYKLVEASGRRVDLTPAALRMVEKLEPLLSEIKTVLADESEAEAGELSIGVTESVLASWGPKLLSDVSQKVPRIKLRIHAHRSPVIVDRVRSGEYAVGICGGVDSRVQGLRSKFLTNEPMIVIPSGMKKVKLNRPGNLEVLTIETHALSWDVLSSQLRTLKESSGLQIKVTQEIQSFSSVVQMAKAGFGHGLCPLGIATALGVSPRQAFKLPGTPLCRAVSYVTRASTLSRPSLQSFFQALDEAAQRVDHVVR